ncbi:hypothetical protein LV779_07290 [Streptomyces thinghirensis]|nr:hypothetical protein [Streptomyces thinghirensis]
MTSSYLDDDVPSVSPTTGWVSISAAVPAPRTGGQEVFRAGRHAGPYPRALDGTLHRRGPPRDAVAALAARLPLASPPTPCGRHPPPMPPPTTTPGPSRDRTAMTPIRLALLADVTTPSSVRGCARCWRPRRASRWPPRPRPAEEAVERAGPGRHRRGPDGPVVRQGHERRGGASRPRSPARPGATARPGSSRPTTPIADTLPAIEYRCSTGYLLKDAPRGPRRAGYCTSGDGPGRALPRPRWRTG